MDSTYSQPLLIDVFEPLWWFARCLMRKHLELGTLEFENCREQVWDRSPPRRVNRNKKVVVDAQRGGETTALYDCKH